MPLDDRFDLTPPPVAPLPVAEVMTRVLRLPTASPRQARAMVRLQLDRLSPLPASSIVYDLAMLRRDGAESVYALGIVRRSAFDGGTTASRGWLHSRQEIEGLDVVFRFRDPDAAGDLEARWLKHAPRAALVALGLAAVMLAANLRAEQWRERRLPEIATAQRLAARDAIDRRETGEALAAWSALSRADAATRFLCIGSRIAAIRPEGVPATAMLADAGRVTLTLSGESRRLTEAGGEVLPSNGALTQVVFPEAVCR